MNSDGVVKLLDSVSQLKKEKIIIPQDGNKIITNIYTAIRSDDWNEVLCNFEELQMSPLSDNTESFAKQKDFCIHLLYSCMQGGQL